MKLPLTVLLLLFSSMTPVVHGFNLVMMGGKRGKGNLKKSLAGESVSSKKSSVKSATIRQEITGVTLPAEGQLKGWEFGNKVTMACANVGGKFYAIQGDCPRCAFDLYKGDLIADDPAWEELPRVACPTCATTYSMVSGKFGPPLKRKGLAGFVGGLTKSATAGDKPKDAEPFQITLDEEGRVFCRKR
jgi:nitrite reductase/ring-hydroxylating ferredoxin subunit